MLNELSPCLTWNIKVQVTSFQVRLYAVPSVSKLSEGPANILGGPRQYIGEPTNILGGPRQYTGGPHESVIWFKTFRGPRQYIVEPTNILGGPRQYIGEPTNILGGPRQYVGEPTNILKHFQ
jgi:hypothetical protein